MTGFWLGPLRIEFTLRPPHLFLCLSGRTGRHFGVGG